MTVTQSKNKIGGLTVSEFYLQILLDGAVLLGVRLSVVLGTTNFIDAIMVQIEFGASCNENTDAPSQHVTVTFDARFVSPQ